MILLETNKIVDGGMCARRDFITYRLHTLTTKTTATYTRIKIKTAKTKNNITTICKTIKITTSI